MRARRFLLPVLLSFFSCAQAWAGEAPGQKLSESLRLHLHGESRADVLVYLRGAADLDGAERIEHRGRRIAFVYDRLRNYARRSQARLLSLLEKRRASYRAFHILNVVSVPSASRALLEEISELEEVAAIRPNSPYALRLPRVEKGNEPPPRGNDIPANISAVKADKVWNELGVKGAGIVVAGQDSGFDWTHPALRRQYRGSLGLSVNHDYSWHDAIHAGGGSGCRENSPEPCDDSGHGTHTMGTMVGDDGAGNRIGVAPEAKWIGCRNMNRGVGTPATYLECFEFFLTPYPRGGNPREDGRPDLAPHVVNNSWACPPSEGCTGEEFLSAVRALRAAGIAVVVAAGNEGPGCGSVTNPPGSLGGEILATAAFDHRDGKIATFSSRGPSSWGGGQGPTLAAPGNVIRSSVPSRLGDGLYDYKSGTSMASPHLTGVIALVWAARPELIGRIEETMRLLSDSATQRTASQNCGRFPGSAIPNAVFGFGQVDAWQAIRR